MRSVESNRRVWLRLARSRTFSLEREKRRCWWCKQGRPRGEYLVPYAEAFLKQADLAARRIEMELPEGLLEVQSPLSDEEKQRQKLEADESREAGERRKGHK